MKRLGLRSRRGSAPAARDRLKLLLAQERSVFGRRDLISSLREDVLAAIAKHVAIDGERVKISMERRGGIPTLGIDIELPAHKSMGFAGA
jgi:cell division topological specificity factor